MELPIFKKDGSQSKNNLTVEPGLIEIKPNKDTIYYAVISQMTNSRQGTNSTKSRSMVSGGGRKPFRQKGTGNARAGTNRSPLWRGGGRIFGPKPHDYNFKLPRKVKKLARISALALKLKEGKVTVVEDFNLEEIKTKYFQDILKSFEIEKKKVLFVTAEKSENIYKSSRNIPNVNVILVDTLSTYDILNCENLLIQKSAFEKINEFIKNN